MTTDKLTPIELQLKGNLAREYDSMNAAVNNFLRLQRLTFKAYHTRFTISQIAELFCCSKYHIKRVLAETD